MHGQDVEVLKREVTEAGMKLRGDCESLFNLTGQCLQCTCTQWVGVSAIRQPDVTGKPWRMWVTERETQATQWIPFLDYERAQQINGTLVEGHRAWPTLKAM